MTETPVLTIESLPPAALTYLRDIQSPWKLFFYYWKNLPSAIWWGFRVKSVSLERAETTIPYCWRTKNPFQSIYFAALCGAGELATGVLANMARLGRGNISLLVLEQRAAFVKKASTLTTFTCEEGHKALEAVRLALETGEPQAVTMMATGRNTAGEVVCRIYITWTYKLRTTST
jgi:hypothetical protein